MPPDSGDIIQIFLPPREQPRKGGRNLFDALMGSGAQADLFDFLGRRPSLGNLKEFFHVTHSMTSERCLPASADTQTGLPAATKADAIDRSPDNIRQRGCWSRRQWEFGIAFSPMAVHWRV